MSVVSHWKNRALDAIRDPGSIPPIYVFGHQKSGTTAIAALFAKLIGEPYHHDLFYTHGWQDNHALFTGTLLADQLLERARRPLSGGVIKDPDFTYVMPGLLNAMPSASALFVVREPKAMIASVLGRLAIPGDATELGGHLEHLTKLEYRLWRNILDCERLGLPPGNHIATLARRWVRAVELYERCETRCLLLRYEDFKQNKLSTLNHIADTFGREAKNDISDILDRQFQPASQPQTNFETFFGKTNNAMIDDLCGEHMTNFGYRHD